MAVTSTAIFPQTIIVGFGQISNTTATTTVGISSAGTNGSKIELIYVTSTDTVSRDIVLSVNNGSTTYTIGTINIPISSGNSPTVPSVSLLQNTQLALPRDENGNPYLYLASGSFLYVNALATVTAGTFLNVFLQQKDF